MTNMANEREIIARLVDALKGVIAVADRKTVEFDNAKAAIAAALDASEAPAADLATMRSALLSTEICGAQGICKMSFIFKDSAERSKALEEWFAYAPGEPVCAKNAHTEIAAAPAQWRPDPAELLRFAARKIGMNSHHCLWLNAVAYRSDPLDQALVNHVLKGAADSLEWLAQNPDKARGMMEYRLERQADHAEEG
jgi:hypothetical protein